MGLQNAKIFPPLELHNKIHSRGRLHKDPTSKPTPNHPPKKKNKMENFSTLNPSVVLSRNLRRNNHYTQEAFNMGPC